MEIFWALFVYMLLVECFFGGGIVGNGNRYRGLRTTLHGIGIWLVLALRSPLNGIDIAGYCRGFTYISEQFSFVESFTEIVYYEQGWVVLNKLISYLTTDIHIFLAIVAGIMIGLVSWGIYKNSKDIFLSFVIFISFGLYVMCFSGLRQSLAFSVTFYSFRFIKEDRFVPFLLCVLLASTFHISSIIFLVAWLVRKVRLPFVKGAWFLAIYCILVIPFLRIFVPIVIMLLFGGEKYQHYQDEGGAITMFVVYSLMFLLSYLIKADNDKRLNFYRWMILFATMCQSLGIISSGAMTRISYYFTIFFPLFFAELVAHVHGFQKKVLSGLGAVLFVIFFYLTTSDGYLDVVPYHFFWESGYESYM